MNFRSRNFLLDHIRHTLAFYDDRCIDPVGGFYHCYMNDGVVFDPSLRTLVASCRFIFNYAKAYKQFGNERYQTYVIHGLKYLRNIHRNPTTGGYGWKINDSQVIDATNHCYGLAFVLLAYTSAYEAGIKEAREWIDETYALMQTHFWDVSHGYYACQADPQWNLDTYRGQNDNMHACEALIAAYEATHQKHFLEQASLIAQNLAVLAAEKTEQHIWEHYTPNWQPDLEYNKNDRTNSLRPWGVQTGHQTEWAKLLLILDRHDPAPWHVERAKALFDSAMEFGWDHDHGGLIYGYDLVGQPYDFDKYFWVQAESIAAAALLADKTQDEHYWHWYNHLWEYSFEHFVDHKYGAWYRILRRDNTRYDDRKSYNNKADYHTMGACYEVLNVIKEASI